jgi:hypothetical protein
MDHLASALAETETISIAAMNNKTVVLIIVPFLLKTKNYSCRTLYYK